MGVTSAVDEAFKRGLAALQAGKVEDAQRAFERVLKAEPTHAAALNLLGILLTRVGRFQAAEHYLKRALRVTPRSDATLYNYAIVLKALKRPLEALECLGQALAINSAVPETWNNRGTILNELHRYNDAIADFDRALSIAPNYAEAYSNKGKAYAGLKLYPEAQRVFDKAVATNPNLSGAWLGLGLVLVRLNKQDEALAAYDKALELTPDFADVWVARGDAYNLAGRSDEASAAYERALALAPNMAEAWLGRGNVLFARQQYADASVTYRKALSIDPNLPDALLGQAKLLMLDDRYGDALAILDKVVDRRPDFVEAWLARLHILVNWREFSDVIACCDKVLAIDPDNKFVPGFRLHARQNLCDWMHSESEAVRVLDMIRSGKPASIPFPLLSIASTPADQLQCAQAFASDIPPVPNLGAGQTPAHDRIRIAYVSADLHEHPVGHLVAGLFEQHDRARFEVNVLSLGPDDGSNTRARLKGAVEHFIDARNKTDEEVAALIREREIDIAVDLNGYTDGGRLEVFARRPAPIQMNYLGYAGTRGAACFDYIVVDRIVLPQDHAPFYSEQPIWLPDSYMVTDRQQPVGEQTPTRSECGLPDAGFVFCCFNNLYKISPGTFGVWMSLLRSIDGSVLWLSDGHAVAKTNLRRQAQEAGVAPERLIFAPRLPAMIDHLARHRQADLFLDTLPYNAHATTAFALWSGLPVLTCLGSTFAGRVAASLLTAVGLDELVTSSYEAYEAMALRLARDPEMLAAVKARLARNRDSYPLFDTTRFTRHVETAYVTAWERYQRGEAPAGFTVEAQNAR